MCQHTHHAHQYCGEWAAKNKRRWKMWTWWNGRKNKRGAVKEDVRRRREDQSECVVKEENEKIMKIISE